MIKNIATHASNLGMRGFTIVLRFALIFGLGKYYSTEDLGVFGLFSTTVTIVIFFLGFDFYAYFHREILEARKSKQIEILLNSLRFFAIVYLIVLPLCFFIFFLNILPLKYILWFYVVIVLEHFSQELYRIFILFGNQFFANVLMFLKVAIWIIPLGMYWVLLGFDNLDLHVVFVLWAIGAGVSVVLGIFSLKRHYGELRAETNISWTWIKKGIPISAQFLVGTLAYKIIEFSDRYFLDFYLDKKAVGVYTFYYNFANVLQTLVFTLVIAQLYPKLVDYFTKGDLVNYNKYKKKFRNEVLLISIVSSIVILFAIIPAIQIIQKPEFYENFYVYIILIVAVTILNISFIPHYILYAQKRDRVVMISAIVCAVINLICNLTLTSRFGLIGSAFSTLISYSVLLVIKYYHSYER